jgi:hypothetical protein
VGHRGGRLLALGEKGEGRAVAVSVCREKEREGTVGEDDSDMWAMLGSEREGERGFPGWCWAGFHPGSAQLG